MILVDEHTGVARLRERGSNDLVRPVQARCLLVWPAEQRAGVVVAGLA